MSGLGTAGPLERYANNSPALVAQGLSTQDRRYLRRSGLWSESGLERVRKCGRVSNTTGGEVVVRLAGEVAGFAGLCTCGSVWACPVCNAKIMARRALELGMLLAAAQSQGWWLAFMTFTARHRQGQPLAPLWDALGYAWGTTTHSRSWVAAKAEHGVQGFLRAAEVTYGANGWHPHLHPVVMGTGKCTPGQVSRLHGGMFATWAAALTRKGYAAPLMVGQDARLIRGPADVVAEYVAKSMDWGTVVGPGAAARTAKPSTATQGDARNLGLELTHTQSKVARRALSTHPAWDLLDQVLGEGDADALDLWHEYEQASKGRRQITYSRGLRLQLLPHLAELTDEEIASQEVGTTADDLVFITADGWQTVVRHPILQPRILAAARTTGLAGVRSLLDAEGVEYRTDRESA